MPKLCAAVFLCRQINILAAFGAVKHAAVPYAYDL
jgi:hypothetical protein